VTLAVHWEPPDEAASSATAVSCKSGKLGFDTPSELRWRLTRAFGTPRGQIYRCPICSQFHFSSQSRTERKRVIKLARRRLGLTGTPSEPEAAS
jgi:hypothetical protein